MPHITLNLVWWNRFLTRNLVIAPDLVGSKHEFTFDGQEVTVSLPGADGVPSKPNEGDLLIFRSYRESNGAVIPIEFWVSAVDVKVPVRKPVSVPEQILDRIPNAYEIVPGGRQAQLNRLVAEGCLIGERVFDIWIRVLRWKSNDGAIGRPEVHGHESGWSTHLVTEPSGQPVWIGRQLITVPPNRVITRQTWEAAEAALCAGQTPPVYVELLFDAVEHMKVGDLQRTVVDTAVGCESFLRLLVANSFPAPGVSSIKEYVDQANIRIVLTKFAPQMLNDQERKKLAKVLPALHRLFNTRNDILHSGRVEGLTAEGCKKFLDAATTLVQLEA